MNVLCKFLALFILSPVYLISQGNFTSSNFPIVVINSSTRTIPDEPKVKANMGIIFNGIGEINNITDPYNNFYGNIGIEVRGSSSQYFFPKKQYGIETRDIFDNDSSVSLLGLPKESDWILHAPYSDKTHLRNYLAYNFSNNIGRYASRTVFCELVLNDEYMGIYILMEKIKRDNDRVDISKMSENDNSGDDLTGGYILNIDRNDNNGFNSNFPLNRAKIYYQYVYPNSKDITNEQKKYINTLIDDFENVLYGNSYNDPFKGYYDYINSNSFVDYLIVAELAKNVDAYRLSTYLYKDKNSKDSRMHLGPIWDYNLAFGNADYDDGWKHEGWEALFPNVSGWISPFWISKIFNDPVFFNKFSKAWKNYRENEFQPSNILAKIDSMQYLLKEASIRNNDKWNVIGKKVWPNKFVGNSYQEEIDTLKSWISNRIKWIDKNINDNYSDVDWISKKDFELIKNRKSFAINELVLSQKNISNIAFIINNKNVILTKTSDSVFISSNINEEFVLKGVGYKDGIIVDISPAYIIHNTTSTDETKINFNYSLHQNFPNPFNPSTQIKYTLPKSGKVKITVFDLLGREVVTLVNAIQNFGSYIVGFDGSNLSSGIYFYRISVNKFQSTKKMILIK